MFVAAADRPAVDRDRAAEIGEAEGDCTAWNVRTLVSHPVAQCEDGISLPTLLRRELTGRRRHRTLSEVDAHVAVQVAEHVGDTGPDPVDRFAVQWPRAVRARRRRPAPLARIPF